MSDTLVFIPSFDRPMQVDATLKTFYRYCKSPELLDVHVLYKASNENYANCYKKLKKEHSMSFFDKEIDFKVDLLQQIHNKKYILFIVDDCIFTKPFDIEECKSALEGFKKSIGFSLRLGRNTTYCYSLDRQNVYPSHFESANEDDSIEFINWTAINDGDFGYPLEVSSSLYKIERIGHLIENCCYENPNSLEWALSCNAPNLIDFGLLFMYNKSVAFCNPINKVQRTNNNREGGMKMYQPDALLKKFEEGYRADIDFYDNINVYGCHQEFPFKMIKVKNYGKK